MCIRDRTNTICVTDVTPPTPVCDEFTRTTVDPATCWARVYANDLDNGSRDNCCNVLHFAVAHMDTITATRTKWTSYWNTNCKADYWKYKSGWDYWLEEYINCFIFKDYIDLTECGENQVVLRVYEACGVPRYDPHLFPCSEHDWFTYNTYTSVSYTHLDVYKRQLHEIVFENNEQNFQLAFRASISNTQSAGFFAIDNVSVLSIQ